MVDQSVSATVLMGALDLPGEFKCIQVDSELIPQANHPVSSAFRYIILTVMWLRPFVLAIVSFQLSPSKLLDFSLFNCGWTIQLELFVLAIAGLWLGILELLTLGTSPGALHSSTQSLSIDCFLLVNVSCSILSLAIEGIGAWFRV